MHVITAFVINRIQDSGFRIVHCAKRLPIISTIRKTFHAISTSSRFSQIDFYWKLTLLSKNIPLIHIQIYLYLFNPWFINHPFVSLMFCQWCLLFIIKRTDDKILWQLKCQPFTLNIEIIFQKFFKILLQSMTWSGWMDAFSWFQGYEIKKKKRKCF